MIARGEFLLGHPDLETGQAQKAMRSLNRAVQG